MAIPVFNPPEVQSYTSSNSIVNNMDVLPLHSGVEQVRAVTNRPLRSYQSVWSNSGKANRDYIESFVHGLIGGAGPFNWTSFDTVPSPTGLSPTLSSVSGGSLGARTYYVGLTWYDSVLTQETEISAEASLALAANTFVLVAIPPTPTGVDSARLYLSESSGALKLETTITTRSWTQTVALAGTADPPTTNNLKPTTVRYLLSPAGLEVTPTSFELYNIKMTFRETFI